MMNEPEDSKRSLLVYNDYTNPPDPFIGQRPETAWPVSSVSVAGHLPIWEYFEAVSVARCMNSNIFYLFRYYSPEPCKL